jgi:hypothetical protein
MVESLIVKALVMGAISGAVTFNSADLAIFRNGESGSKGILKEITPLSWVGAEILSTLDRQPKTPIKVQKEAVILRSMGAFQLEAGEPVGKYNLFQKPTKHHFKW